MRANGGHRSSFSLETSFLPLPEQRFSGKLKSKIAESVHLIDAVSADRIDSPQTSGRLPRLPDRSLPRGEKISPGENLPTLASRAQRVYGASRAESPDSASSAQSFGFYSETHDELTSRRAHEGPGGTKPEIFELKCKRINPDRARYPVMASLRAERFHRVADVAVPRIIPRQSTRARANSTSRRTNPRPIDNARDLL